MSDPIYYNDPDQGPYQDMYDPTGTLQRVREDMVSNRTAQGWSAALPSLVVSGTAVPDAADSEIVNGGETIIFTLTTGTWDSNVLAQLEALNEGTLLNGSGSGGGSFDNEVSIDFTSDCVRTSDTVLTLTLPAAASYAGSETVTINIPINLVSINGTPITASGNLVASPAAFDIAAL